ncbi:MAG: hypothetical protein ACE5JI_02450 [Acidobacteriota bacterium]
MKGLSQPGRSLLDRVKREGTLRTDRLSSRTGKKTGDLARELETRLLVHSQQVHTKSGAHAKILESWRCWGQTVKLGLRVLAAEEAWARLEELVEDLNRRYRGRARLPWSRTGVEAR